MVFSLDEIRAVNVQEEKVRYFGKGYLVVLRFVTGLSHPLTQNAVMGCRRYSVHLLLCDWSGYVRKLHATLDVTIRF